MYTMKLLKETESGGEGWILVLKQSEAQQSTVDTLYQTSHTTTFHFVLIDELGSASYRLS